MADTLQGADILQASPCKELIGSPKSFYVLPPAHLCRSVKVDQEDLEKTDSCSQKAAPCPHIYGLQISGAKEWAQGEMASAHLGSAAPKNHRQESEAFYQSHRCRTMVPGIKDPQQIYTENRVSEKRLKN